MIKKLEWNDVNVGDTLLYEEGYSLQSKVKVLQKEVSEDYINFSVEIVEAYRGCEVGNVLQVGKSMNSKYSYLVSNMKFKPLDGFFDYL